MGKGSCGSKKKRPSWLHARYWAPFFPGGKKEGVPLIRKSNKIFESSFGSIGFTPAVISFKQVTAHGKSDPFLYTFNIRTSRWIIKTHDSIYFGEKYNCFTYVCAEYLAGKFFTYSSENRRWSGSESVVFFKRGATEGVTEAPANKAAGKRYRIADPPHRPVIKHFHQKDVGGGRGGGVPTSQCCGFFARSFFALRGLNPPPPNFLERPKSALNHSIQ